MKILKKFLILFFTFILIFSCNKNQNKKRVELCELPRDSDKWTIFPDIDPIMDGLYPDELIFVDNDNIKFNKKFDYSFQYQTYDTYAKVKKDKPIEVRYWWEDSGTHTVYEDSIHVFVGISEDKNNAFVDISILYDYGDSKDNYTVKFKKRKNIEKYKKMFFKEGLFAVLDDIQKLELNYKNTEGSVSKKHYYKDTEFTE